MSTHKRQAQSALANGSVPKCSLTEAYLTPDELVALSQRHVDTPTPYHPNDDLNGRCQSQDSRNPRTRDSVQTRDVSVDLLDISFPQLPLGVSSEICAHPDTRTRLQEEISIRFSVTTSNQLDTVSSIRRLSKDKYTSSSRTHALIG